jgi:hypothetical protein
MKIHPVEAELFRVERGMGGQKKGQSEEERRGDMTKLAAVFHSSAKAPKMDIAYNFIILILSTGC